MRAENIIYIALSSVFFSPRVAAAASLMPDNPAFTEYMRSGESGLEEASSDSGGPVLKPGYIPPVVDRSYLKSRNSGKSGPSGALRTQSGFYPSAYTVPYLPEIRDQGDYHDCWAYAVLASLESNLLKNGTVSDFSEYHMALNHGFAWGVAKGGDYDIALAFLTRWAGPVEEITVNTYGSETLAHLQGAVYLADPDSSDAPHSAFVSDMKYAVENYGPVFVAVNTSGFDSSYSNMYNSSSRTNNHAAAVIGWDDDYPGTNFKNAAPGDGAFYVRNSWGASYGINGYFWLSYYDKCMNDSAAFAVPESTSNYDNIYDYTPYGEVNSWKADSADTAVYEANVFTAGGYERLRAVSFFADVPGSQVSVSVYTGLSADTDPVSGTEHVFASTVPAYAGYYTLSSDQNIELSSGAKFAVAVRQVPPSGEYMRFGTEGNKSGYLTRAVSAAGQSYYKEGENGSWADTHSSSVLGGKQNMPVKAFTEDIRAAGKVPAVRNGTGTVDRYFTNSLSELNANWDSADNAAEYSYIISRSKDENGKIYDWESAGSGVSVNVTGLALTAGDTYYFGVMAANEFNEFSGSVTWSQGICVDTVPPVFTLNGVESYGVYYSTAADIPGSLGADKILSDVPVLSGVFPCVSGSCAKNIPLEWDSSVYVFNAFIETYYTSGVATFTVSGTDEAGNAGDIFANNGKTEFYININAGSGKTALDGDGNPVDVSFANSDGTSLLIPAGALDSSVSSLNVIISTYASDLSENALAAAEENSPGSAGLGLLRDFSVKSASGGSISSFNSAATITIPYGSAGLSGYPEEYLRLFYLDENKGEWVYSDSSADKINKTVTGRVSHMSVYSVRALKSSDDSVKPLVYPNPARLSVSPNEVIFSGIPLTVKGVKLYIYNLSGELVRSLTPSGGTDEWELGWDGRTKNGEKAASGIYLYLVKTRTNGQARGKFYIIW